MAIMENRLVLQMLREQHHYRDISSKQVDLVYDKISDYLYTIILMLAQHCSARLQQNIKYLELQLLE